MNKDTFSRLYEGISNESKQRAEISKEKARALLGRIRDGEAAHEEKTAVIAAIKFMQTKRFNSENERQVYILTSYYLSPERPTLYTIAEQTYCSYSTVKRDRELAIERLAILLYGADAIAWE